MKKACFIVLLLFVTNYGFCQYYRPLTMTINAGGNLSNLDVKNVDHDPIGGYRGGLNLEISYPKGLFLQTGIEITSKGASREWNTYREGDGEIGIGKDYITEEKINMTYLILPLRTGYRMLIANDLILNMSVGPYFGYGIGGKTTLHSFGIIEDKPLDEESKEDSFSDERYKKFDMGLTGLVSFEYRRFLLNFGYESALISHARNKPSRRNNSVFITLGFRVF